MTDVTLILSAIEQLCAQVLLREVENLLTDEQGY
jgi:hypothetical protein